MAIQMDEVTYKGAKIMVVGVGGGGGNAVNNMIQRNIENVEFVVMNTDLQVLELSPAKTKIQLGKNLTRGLGAGGNPDIGKKAIEEDREEITRILRGVDLVFITAGMGGGTGTGAAPVVAEIAKSLGILTVCVVSKPFSVEGPRKIRQADTGLEELRKHVDTLLIVPNERVLALVDKGLDIISSFGVANDVLYDAVKGLSDIITRPGYVNLDFADVVSVMKNMGDAVLGIGRASGENRAIEAAQNAISSPLLDSVSIEGSENLLVNIIAGKNMIIHEMTDASRVITELAGKDANVFIGFSIDDQYGDEMVITVIATGFNKKEQTPKSRPSNIVPLPSSVPNPTPAQEPTFVSRQEDIRPMRHNGLENLQRLDEPAITRNQKSVEPQTTIPQQAKPQTSYPFANLPRFDKPENKERIDKTDTEKPAFLRRIMD